MRNTIFYYFIFFLYLILLQISCGVKKPPETPEAMYPLKIKDFQIRVQGNCADLSWVYPGTRSPERFRIQRRAYPLKGEQAEEEKIFEVSGKESTFQDCSLRSGFFYTYQVSGISRFRLASEPSKTLGIKLSQIPSPPENFQAISGDRFIELSWQAAPELSYNLYRSSEPEQFAQKPLNPTPIKEAKYSDLGLRNGKTYYYCLRAVVLAKNSLPVESKCALLSAVPVDLIAPSAPRGLVVVRKGKAVWLKWFQNPEPDLAGYLVYRRRVGERVWKQLTPEPIIKPEYLDEQVAQFQGEFEYAVSAVDQAESRNQSQLSAPGRISLP